MQCTSTYPVYKKNDNRLGKRNTRNHKDGEEEFSIGGGCRRGHQSGGGRRIQERGALVLIEDKQAAAAGHSCMFPVGTASRVFCSYHRKHTFLCECIALIPSGIQQHSKTRMSKPVGTEYAGHYR